MPENWLDIMAALRGPRLAIYDDLLRCGAMDYDRLTACCATQLDVEAALAWLVVRRMVFLDGGQWAARPLAVARETYERDGPAEAPAGAPRQRIETGARAVVQPHQVQFFEMDGYQFNHG